MDISHFRDEMLSLLGANLICLLHTGSHARGEPRPDSDYDFALIVSKVDKKVLNDLRKSQEKFERVSIFVLEEADLKTRPKAMYLQFIYSKSVFGRFEFSRPTADACMHACIESYIAMMRRDEVDTFRHYIIFPHDPDKLTARIRFSLKYAYICLTYIVFKETGQLPKTRIETLEYFEKRVQKKKEYGYSRCCRTGLFKKKSSTATPTNTYI
jgi:predicted nucleotidyltransferase